MRAPCTAGYLVAEIAEPIGFPVVVCAECGADSGLQIGRSHALLAERVVELAYLIQQARDIGHRAGERYLAPLASSGGGQLAEPAGVFVQVDGQGRQVPRRVSLLLVVDRASTPSVGGS